MPTPSYSQRQIEIRRYTDVAGIAGLGAQLDAIFFQSSNTQSFESDAKRARFRERWLGRYLTHYPQWAYVALADENRVAGYLAGCLDDPALTELFSDNAHFKIFKDLTRRFPAHLHVNLGADDRGGGVGSRLVQRFCDDAWKAGSPGVHVMTGRQARNVGFYARNGFSELGFAGDGASEVVFLGREL